MTAFVLDASVALSWFFKDEASNLATAVFSMMEEQEALVPYHWHAEVANGIVVGERKGRTQPEWIETFTRSLQEFDFLVERPAAESRAMALIPLARTHQLSIYDALYLDLAMRRNLPIATLDGPLKKAAVRAGVQLIEAS